MVGDNLTSEDELALSNRQGRVEGYWGGKNVANSEHCHEDSRHNLLHCEVGFDVEVRGGRVLVADPEGDNGDVYSGLEQVHRSRVPAMSSKT